jgi:hypothetical protein
MTDKNKTLIENCFIINLNSKNALKKNGTFNSNVIFNIPNLLTKDKNVIMNEVIVQNFTMPLSFYIINEYNNILNYTYNGSNFTINITYGNYNAYTFMTLLTSLFLINGHTMNISLDNSTSILTFISSLSFSFLSSSSANYIIGFYSTLNSISNTIICSYPINLLGSQKINVYSTTLNEGNYDAHGPIILSLPCNQPQFSMISYENLTNGFFNLGSLNLSNIDIQIRNENGQLLDLNNQDFTIALKIKRHKFINTQNFDLNDVLNLPN